MTHNITLICPAYNEQDSIGNFLRDIDSIVAPLLDSFCFQVVIVNDGSSDNTRAVVSDYRAQHFDLTLCNFTRNFGKEAAIVAGLERYSGDAFIIMDTDLQHPPTLITQMLEQWQAGHKVVESVKSHRGEESATYKFFSQLFYHSLYALSSLQLQNQSDYKLLDAEVVAALRQLPEKQRFFRGLVEWLGYPSMKISFEVPLRENDSSSWSLWGLFKYSIYNLTSLTSAPLHLVTLIGILMLFISALFGSITLYQWFLGEALTGFTTVILLLLFIGSVLMVSLGLIGLYISRIYDEIKARPIFLIKDEITRKANKLNIP
ncbi:MAG: glycosyltransferase involved in cell wall biosynthesis [Oleiphilaceae bacterium]|jgi:glycosyltransferase involved in cell wall biosynthesis